MIVLYGLADRFLSFRDLSQDVSLMERLLESRTILDRMAYNPIAGYGLGVTYDRYYMVLGNIIPTSFIHNGYLSAWFKLGLPGLAVCLAIMALLVTGTFRWIRQGHADMTRLELTMAMAMFGVLISMLVVNVTSAQFYSFEGWMVLTLHAAYLSHRIGGRDGEATEAYDPAESMATSDPASTSATSKRSPSGER
jgi:O-antigen ligase